MKRGLNYIFILAVFLFYGCKNEQRTITTKSVFVGENKCTIQKLPENYDLQSGERTKFDYYRILIESKTTVADSSDINYINFGVENSIHKISNSDTIVPAFLQRIANGKKNVYEYIVSFEKQPGEDKYEIVINDEVFEMGLIRIMF